MYPLSPTHTLEVGDMWHPDIGEHKGHEEMWRDEDILPVTMLSTHLPDSTKETTTTNTTLATTGRKDCIVLRLHSPTNSVRGVVIRVGQYIQGIVMKGRYSSVERWEWKDTEGWKRTARIGDQFLPCMVTAREDVLNVGGRVRYFDYEWVVEEVWRWE